MSQRELNDALIEWIVGTVNVASISLDGETGAVNIDGVTVLINGQPVSVITFFGAWSAVVDYPVGAIVTATDGDLYISIDTPNLNNDPTGGGSPLFWTKIIDVPDLSTATILTESDESASLPASLVLTAGTGITLTPGAGTLTIDAAATGGVESVQQAADQNLTGSLANTDLVTDSVPANGEVWIRATMLFAAVSNGSGVSVKITLPGGATAPALLFYDAETGPGTINDTVGDEGTTFASGDPGAGGVVLATLEGVVRVGATPGVVTVQVMRNGAAGILRAGAELLYQVNP